MRATTNSLYIIKIFYCYYCWIWSIKLQLIQTDVLKVESSSMGQPIGYTAGIDVSVTIKALLVTNMLVL